MPRHKVLGSPATADYELDEVYRELVADHSRDGGYVSLADIQREHRRRFEAKRRDHGTKTPE